MYKISRILFTIMIAGLGFSPVQASAMRKIGRIARPILFNFQKPIQTQPVRTLLEYKSNQVHRLNAENEKFKKSGSRPNPGNKVCGLNDLTPLSEQELKKYREAVQFIAGKVDSVIAKAGWAENKFWKKPAFNPTDARTTVGMFLHVEDHKRFRKFQWITPDGSFRPTGTGQADTIKTVEDFLLTTKDWKLEDVSTTVVGYGFNQATGGVESLWGLGRDADIMGNTIVYRVNAVNGVSFHDPEKPATLLWYVNTTPDGIARAEAYYEELAKLEKARN